MVAVSYNLVPRAFPAKKFFEGKALGTRLRKLDIHSLTGKLPEHKNGWAPPVYKYMGPYNPLDKQVEYNTRTQEKY